MTEALRLELEDRRSRLATVVSRGAGDSHLTALLHEVDLALERVQDGTYGLCETCHDPIEPDRLAADPLLRRCLDHLTSAELRALEYDLGMASEVQRALLPPPDVVHGRWELAYQYVPYGAVSGDYCDFVIPPEAAGGPVYVLLGDISGKGVAASMLMSHLHAMIRALIGLSVPFKQVLERVNRSFCEATLPSHYATLVFGRLDVDGRADLAVAGHLPPLIVRGGQVTRIGGSSFPIGMFCSANHEPTPIRFERGDLMVLLTDGLTEAQNAKDDDYGLDRVEALLKSLGAASARRAIDVLLEDARDFAGGKPWFDDLTIVAVRRL